MTTQEWLLEVDAKKDKLRYLLERYHPANTIKNYHQKRLDDKLRITASATEQACENVRKNIRENYEGNPVEQFQEALDNKDVSKIMKLLNEAWFGMPESTSCWNITGFKEAVSLMDDPPDDDYNGPEPTINNEKI